MDFNWNPEEEAFRHELRSWLEPAFFTTLKRGGPAADYHVQAVIYCGGKLFRADDKDEDIAPRPYRVLNFNQRG